MQKEMIKFLRTRKETKLPARAFGDAGIDFFIPEYSEEFVRDLLLANLNKSLLVKTGVIKSAGQSTDEGPKYEYDVGHFIVLPAHCDIKIPSGIKSWIHPDYVLMFTNKSGVAIKKRLDVSATTVDSRYQGEIHLCLVNTSDEPVTLEFGEKIVQGIVHRHYADNFVTHDGIEDPVNAAKKFYEGCDNSRGDSGFGSTGTK